MYPQHPPENPLDVDEADPIHGRDIPIECVESNHTNANRRHIEDFIRDIYVRCPLPPNYDPMDYCNSNKYPAVNCDARYRSYTDTSTNYLTYPQDSNDYCPCGSNDVGVTGYKWCKKCRNEKNKCQCDAIRGTWGWDLRYVDGCDQCRGRYKVSKELWGPPIYPGGRYGLDWEDFMKDQHGYERADDTLARYKGIEKVVGIKVLDVQAESSAVAEKCMGKGKAREAPTTESGTDDDTCSDCARACKTPLSTDEERSCFEDCERMEAESRTYEELFRACIEDIQVADIPTAIIGAFEQRMAQHEYIESAITTHNEVAKDLAWRNIIEGAYWTQNDAGVRETTEAHAARSSYKIQLKSLGPVDREVFKKAEANRVYVGGMAAFEEQVASKEAIDQVVVEERVQAEVGNFLRDLREEFRQNELKQKQSTKGRSIVDGKARYQEAIQLAIDSEQENHRAMVLKVNMHGEHKHATSDGVLYLRGGGTGESKAAQWDVHQDATELGPGAGARTATEADFSAEEEIGGNGEEGLGPESFQYQHDHSCC